MLFFEFKNENETKYIFFLRDKKTEMFVHKKNETLTSLKESTETVSWNSWAIFFRVKVYLLEASVKLEYSLEDC